MSIPLFMLACMILLLVICIGISSIVDMANAGNAVAEYLIAVMAIMIGVAVVVWAVYYFIAFLCQAPST